MTGTMTWVGMDVHARSTPAAAIDSMTGELVCKKFGPGVDEPVGWLQGLAGPVRACYEAGPTGYGLYRAAVAAGVAIDVIAPGKTPLGPSDRVKTDRKDAGVEVARLVTNLDSRSDSCAEVLGRSSRWEAGAELSAVEPGDRGGLVGEAGVDEDGVVGA